MRIAHVITGLRQGGAERSLYSLVSATSDVEHVVISLTGNDYYGKLCMDAGARVHALHMQGPLSLIKGLFQLRALLKTANPTVVQTWMYHANVIGGLVACSLRFPAVWNIRMTNPFSPSYSRSTQMVARLSALLSRWVPKKIIYCASSAKVAHESNGFDKTKSVIITNGYDLSIFKPDSAAGADIRNSVNASDSTLVFGAVGRYDHVKNYPGLMDGLAQFDKEYGLPWLCLLVGSGMDESNQTLQELIATADLRDKVILFGPATHMVPLHNALNYLISNSLDEGFPNVIAEAQACGTPAIATDAGDSKAIIGDLGWVVPVRAQAELVAALKKAAEQFGSHNYIAMADACRAKAKDTLDITSMTNQYEQVWHAQAKLSGV